MLSLILNRIVLIVFLAISFSAGSDAVSSDAVSSDEAISKPKKKKKSAEEKKNKNAVTMVHYKRIVQVKNEEGEIEEQKEAVDISFSKLQDNSSQECKVVCKAKRIEADCKFAPPFRCKMIDKKDPARTKEVIGNCKYDTSFDDGPVCVFKSFKLEKDYKDPQTGATYRRYTDEK